MPTAHPYARRPGYVEGRLRIAERERARRLARDEAVASGSGKAGKGGPVAATQEEHAAAAAAADAVMAALLEEEEAAKEKAERQKAKKAARKQKKVAETQVQQVVAATTQASDNEAEEQEEAPPQQQEAEPSAEEVVEVLAATSLHDRPSSRASWAGSKQSKQAVSAFQQQQQQSKVGSGRQGRGSNPSTPVSRVPGASAAPSPKQPAAARTTAKPVAVPAPVSTRRAHSSSGAGSVSATVGDGSSSAPRGPPAVLPPRSASAAAVMRPAGRDSALQQLQQQQRQQPEPVSIKPSGPYAAAALGQRPGAPTLPATRPASRASAAASVSQASAAGDVQQEALELRMSAPSITRPSGLGGAQAAQPPVAATAAPAAPRTVGPWASPGTAAAAAAAAAAAGTGLLPTLLVTSQQAYALPHSMQAAAARMAAEQRSLVGVASPAASAGVLPTAPLPVQRPAQADLASSASSFVPLFGLNLPSSLGGLAGVDWSMPGGATATTAFGSPAQQPAPPAAPPVAPALPPPPQFLRAGAPVGQPASASPPSDASSIESSEADDLLNGIHGHVRRGLQLHDAALMASPAAAPLGLPSAKAAAALASPAHVQIGSDEDGIDDVLRMQPWLGDT